MTRRRFLPHGAIVATAAFAVWASALTLLYVVQALGCRFGWDGDLPLHQAALFAVWVVHLVPLALLLAALRQAEVPMRRTAIGATVAALAATLWTGLPLFLASACR